MPAINTALVAEYLALTHLTPKHPTDADFRRMNQLALQLAMELPDSVWGVIIRGLQSGIWQGAWDAVDAVRALEHPDDPRNREHAVRHGPQAAMETRAKH